ncbi:Permease of the drug/metabolite transporter (DMT) superfamily [Evansella caseinilytica]|uniref:Permease of the drug/metabolite transporter (DMT) superfamily n=1 Tax=Evansella caseinilytica TaxID=1503961 RepID=A0A1H3SK12_9BACI|nr:DMT family transporter [Evansella caseinilytica]SDZ38403.1 Permease of the drug/metabolite transporter (DMT) superfamily [Evansella caseinilytica]
MKTSVGLLLTISIIAVSFAAIFVKWSDAPATISSMYRMYLACLFLLPVVWVKKGEFKKLTKQDWLVLMTAGVFLALHFALWFGSLKLTTVASSTLILSLQPIVALIGGYVIYKESVGMLTLIPIGIAMTGVALVGWGDFAFGSMSAMIGNLLSFLSVIAVVGYLFIGQSKVKAMAHWIYSFCVFLFAGIALTIYNLIAGIPIGGYEMREWGVFFLLAVFPTIAHVIFNHLLNYVNTTTISMSILGEPVGATILAILLLGERVNALQVVGGFIVLFGVFFFLSQQSKTNKRENKPESLADSG